MPVPVLRGEGLGSEPLDPLTSLGEPPAEAEQGAGFPAIFEKLAAEADEKGVGQKVPVFELVGVRSVEKDRREAKEAKGMRNLTERRERIDPKSVLEVAAIYQLHPAESVPIAACRRLDGRPAIGKSACTLAAPERIWVFVGGYGRPNRSLHVGPAIGDLDRSRVFRWRDAHLDMVGTG